MGKKSKIGQNKRFRHVMIGKAALYLVESALLAHVKLFPKGKECYVLKLYIVVKLYILTCSKGLFSVRGCSVTVSFFLGKLPQFYSRSSLVNLLDLL